MRPTFGFAPPPPVLHDATKLVTMNNVTSLCRSKRLRISHLLALLTDDAFLKLVERPKRDRQPRRSEEL